MKPLHQLHTGEKAFIVDMRDTKLCVKFFELGVFPGDVVEVKENDSNNDTLTVVINKQTYKLYKSAAKSILTNVVSLEFSLN